MFILRSDFDKTHQVFFHYFAFLSYWSKNVSKYRYSFIIYHSRGIFLFSFRKECAFLVLVIILPTAPLMFARNYPQTRLTATASTLAIPRLSLPVPGRSFQVKYVSRSVPTYPSNFLIIVVSLASCKKSA